MKKMNSLVSFLLAVAIVFSSIAPIFARESITDMPKGWSKEYMEAAVDNGILIGDNGKVRPSDNMTRAEFVTVISRILGLSEKGDVSQYTDVKPGDWHYDDIARAVKAGLVDGRSSTKMEPNGPIKREEAFTIMARMLLLSEDKNHSDVFADSNKISDWAKPSINALAKGDYIEGNDYKQLKPRHNITREEMSALIYRLIDLYVDEDLVGKEVEGNVIVNDDIAKIKDTVIYGDLILGEGVDVEEVKLNNVKVDGRIIVRSDADLKLINGCEINHLKATDKTIVKLDEDSKLNKKNEHIVVKDIETETPGEDDKPTPEKPEEKPEETPEAPLPEIPTKPEETPEKPEETPEKPEETPEKPEETPEKPEETPEKPEETPEKPEETPEKPEETPGGGSKPKPEKLDKSKLEGAIKGAKNKSEELADSKNIKDKIINIALKGAIKEAEEVLTKEDVTQKELDDAAEKLNNILEEIEKEDEPEKEYTFVEELEMEAQEENDREKLVFSEDIDKPVMVEIYKDGELVGEGGMTESPNFGTALVNLTKVGEYELVVKDGDDELARIPLLVTGEADPVIKDVVKEGQRFDLETGFKRPVWIEVLGKKLVGKGGMTESPNFGTALVNLTKAGEYELVVKDEEEGKELARIPLTVKEGETETPKTKELATNKEGEEATFVNKLEMVAQEGDNRAKLVFSENLNIPVMVEIYEKEGLIGTGGMTAEDGIAKINLTKAGEYKVVVKDEEDGKELARIPLTMIDTLKDAEEKVENLEEEVKTLEEKVKEAKKELEEAEEKLADAEFNNSVHGGFEQEILEAEYEKGSAESKLKEAKEELAKAEEELEEAKEEHQKELVDSTKEDTIMDRLKSLKGKSIEEQEEILEDIDKIVENMSREPKEVVQKEIDKAVGGLNELKEKEAKKEEIKEAREELKEALEKMSTVDRNNYTEDSFQKLSAAYSKGMDILESKKDEEDDLNLEELEELKKEIENAKEEFEEALKDKLTEEEKEAKKELEEKRGKLSSKLAEGNNKLSSTKNNRHTEEAIKNLEEKLEEALKVAHESNDVKEIETAIEEIDNAIEEIEQAEFKQYKEEKAAEEEVEKAEQSGTIESLDHAQKVVDALEDSEKKEELKERLGSIENLKLNLNSIAVDETLKLTFNRKLTDYEFDNILDEYLTFQMAQVYRDENGKVIRISNKDEQKGKSQTKDLTMDEVSAVLDSDFGGSKINWEKLKVTREDKVVTISIEKDLINHGDLTNKSKIGSENAIKDAGYKITVHVKDKPATGGKYKIQLNTKEEADSVVTGKFIEVK